jgi:hypothetical protein
MNKIYLMKEFKKDTKKTNQNQNDDMTCEITKLLSKHGTSPIVINEIENKLTLLKDAFLAIPSKTVSLILKVLLVLSCCPLVGLAIYVNFHPYILTNNEFKILINIVNTDLGNHG